MSRRPVWTVRRAAKPSRADIERWALETGGKAAEGEHNAVDVVDVGGTELHFESFALAQAAASAAGARLVFGPLSPPNLAAQASDPGATLSSLARVRRSGVTRAAVACALADRRLDGSRRPVADHPDAPEARSLRAQRETDRRARLVVEMAARRAAAASPPTEPSPPPPLLPDLAEPTENDLEQLFRSASEED